jgi:hypothetical protein
MISGYETQQITAPSCPYPAIMSRLSISGRVIAGLRAANPSKPSHKCPAQQPKPYPPPLGSNDTTTATEPPVNTIRTATKRRRRQDRARVSGALRRRALDPTAGRASGRPITDWSAAQIRGLDTVDRSRRLRVLLPRVYLLAGFSFEGVRTWVYGVFSGNVRRPAIGDSIPMAGQPEARKPLTAEQLVKLEQAWADLAAAAEGSAMTNFHTCTRTGRPWTEDPAAVRAVAATLCEFPGTGGLAGRASGRPNPGWSAAETRVLGTGCAHCGQVEPSAQLRLSPLAYNPFLSDPSRILNPAAERPPFLRRGYSNIYPKIVV